MKVLSLLQPWAQLVVMGVKQVETRSWQTKYRGIVLIHASAGMSKLCKETCSLPPFDEYIHGWQSLERGAIIGQVCIGDNIPTEQLRVSLRKSGNTKELAFGDYNPHRYGWHLHKPLMYKTPIPAKGALGLWEYAGVVPEYDGSLFIPQEKQIIQGALNL